MTKEPRRSFNYDDRFVSEINDFYLSGLYIPAHFRVVNRLEFLKTHYRDRSRVGTSGCSFTSSETPRSQPQMVWSLMMV